MAPGGGPGFYEIDPWTEDVRLCYSAKGGGHEFMKAYQVKKQWQVGQVITESGGKVAGFIWAHDERPMDRKFQIQQGHNVQVRNWARQHKTEVLAQKYRDGAIDEGRAPVKFAVLVG